MTPRGGSDAVEGVGVDGELRVRVSAPPLDSQANRALLELLAAELRVGLSRVTLEKGTTGRHKRLRVEGLSGADLRSRWPGLRTE
ncbi:DUF167 domain-containing protein [soil metagenome]